MKPLAIAALLLGTTAIPGQAQEFQFSDTGHTHGVTLGGDARIGMIFHDIDPDAFIQNYDHAFTSRVRISLSARGETDGGLAFGASLRLDNAEDAANGQAGTVYVGSGNHRLTMGDIAQGDEAAVGQVSGVGLTDLGSHHEVSFDNADGNDPTALYAYTGDNLSFYASATSSDEYGVGVRYDSSGGVSSAGMFFALGYGRDDDGDDEVSLGLGGVVGGTSLTFVTNVNDDRDTTDSALSVDQRFGLTTLTAFARRYDFGIGTDDHFGLGVSHDLGGGAKFKAGVVDSDAEAEHIYDLGLSFSF